MLKNNKIFLNKIEKNPKSTRNTRIVSYRPYRKAFPMSGHYKISTEYKIRPLESYGKILAQSNSWIEKYACQYKICIRKYMLKIISNVPDR